MKCNLDYFSFESFGTVDGPGIRNVFFLSGCPLRCKYCHNPESWQAHNKVISNDEVLNMILKYKSFTKSGGVTFSGGEPLLQSKSLLELFKALKENNIHTCLDTSGNVILTDTIKELMLYTDLVLLDIKQINDQKHIELTTKSNKLTLEFAKYLSSINKKMWIRYVLVPGITSDIDDLKKLREFIDDLNGVEKVEVIPYHKLGIQKYQMLGLKYELNDVNEPTTDEINIAEDILIK